MDSGQEAGSVSGPTTRYRPMSEEFWAVISTPYATISTIISLLESPWWLCVGVVLRDPSNIGLLSHWVGVLFFFGSGAADSG